MGVAVNQNAVRHPHVDDGDIDSLIGYADLRSYVGSAPTISLTGYGAASATSGIAGAFARDDSDTTSADNGGTVIVANNGKRWKRIYSGPAHAAWWGVKADGVTDDKPALDYALSSIRTNVGQIYPSSGMLQLPRGTIYYNGTLTLNSSVHLIGHGSGSASGSYGTKIQFPSNTAGVVVLKGTVGPDQDGADASILEGIYFQGSGYANTAAHGVAFGAGVKMRDCAVVTFGGNGIHIAADVGAGTNANTWEIDTVTVLLNGGHGLYAQGGDSNAGLCSKLNALSNGRFGVCDVSFLGNTYVACHADSNGYEMNGKTSQVHYAGSRYYVVDEALASTTTPGTNSAVWGLVGAGGEFPGVYPTWVSGGSYVQGGAYKADSANAPTALIGCYSESGQAPSVLGGLATFVGGMHAGGLAKGASGRGLFVDGSGVDHVYTGLTTSGGRLACSAEAGGDANAVLALTTNDDNPFRLKYFNKYWALNYNNSQDTFRIFNGQSTLASGVLSRDFDAGSFGLGAVYFHNLTRVDRGVSAPATGTFKSGDVRYNSAPIAGGVMGWVCVADGTPGVWQKFCVVDLSGSATFDPGSLADGVGETTTVTVTGAALGDYAQASFSLDLQGVTVTAWVSAANTVSVRFQNESGGVLDLGSGTLRVKVTKA